ncbi:MULTISPECIES: VOC family protein [unclassified Nocardioides]|uniref:VOC family protein n=1 Tax=unclassified Nocardioides TaxID=2615069 RepID=UPI000A8EE969|nr:MULTISPECIES: VOC family protein [unclassified Nocardioides]
MRIHHVQVACQRGGQDDARRFYADGLGMTEVPKPAELAKRGGCWFRWYDASGVPTAEIHVGVEEPFAPARKAHPAFLLGSVDELETVAGHLSGLGFETDWRSTRSKATSDATPSMAPGTGWSSSRLLGESLPTVVHRSVRLG